MALNAGVLSKLMVAQGASKGILGSEFPKFCLAFSEGIIEAFLEQNTVTTIDVGLVSVILTGSGKGKMIGISSSPMLRIAIPLMVAGQIFGTKSVALADAIINAIVIHFIAANIVNTSHIPLAIGTGTGKVLGLSLYF